MIHTEGQRLRAGSSVVATCQYDPVWRRATPPCGRLQHRRAGVEVPDDGLANALPGPPIDASRTDVGKTFVFKVTGVASGSLWGTDIYTTDSTLGMAAVHCGLVQPGQKREGRVTMLPGQAVSVTGGNREERTACRQVFRACGKACGE